MSEFGSASQVAPLLLRDDGHIARRQLELERQLHAMSGQELRQSQLRPAGGLASNADLQQELLGLRKHPDVGSTEVVAMLQEKLGRIAEAKVAAALDQERSFWEASLSKLGNKLAEELIELKLKLPSLAGVDDLNEFRKDVRRQHEELSHSHQSIAYGLDHHSSFQQDVERRLGTMRSLADQEKSLRDVHHQGLAERLEKLEDEVRTQVNRRFIAVEGELVQMRSLVATAGGDNGSNREVLQRGPSLMEDLKAQQANCEKRLKRMEQTVVADIDRMEQSVAADIDQQWKELELLKCNLQEIKYDLQKTHKHLGDSETKSSLTMDAVISSVQNRMDKMETTMEEGLAPVDSLQRGLMAVRDTTARRLESTALQLDAALESANNKHSRELNAALASMKASGYSQEASLTERVARLEQALGSSAALNSEELRGAHEKLGQLAGRIIACEAYTSEIPELQASYKQLLNSKQAVEAQQVSCKQRLERLDGLANKQASDSEISSDRLSLLQNRVASCEQQLGVSGAVGDLRKQLATLTEREASTEAQQSSLNQRLEALDSSHKQVSERHNQFLEEQQVQLTAQADLLGQFESFLGQTRERQAELSQAQQARASIQEQQADELQALKASKDTLQDRLKAAEKVTRDQGLEITKELASARNLLEGLLARASGLETNVSHLKKDCALLVMEKESLAEQHSSLQQRVEAHAQLSSDFAERLGKKHNVLRDSLERLECRTVSLERLVPQLADVQRLQEDLENDHRALHLSNNSLKEKLDYTSSICESSSERLRADCDSLKTALGKHARDLEGLRAGAAQQAVVVEGLTQVDRRLGDEIQKLKDELAALVKQVAQQGQKLGAQELQGSNLKDLSKSMNAMAGEKTSLAARLESLKDRLERAEKDWRISSEEQASERHAAQSQVDELQSRVMRCETHTSTIADLRRQHNAFAGQRAALDTAQNALTERLGQLEEQQSDSGAKHAAALKQVGELSEAQVKADALIGQQAKEIEALSARCAATGNKVSCCEEQLDSRGQELASTKSQIDVLIQRIDGENAAATSSFSTLKDSLAKEKDHRTSVQGSLKEQIDLLERHVGESTQRHNRDLEESRSTQTRLASKSQGQEVLLEATTERIKRLENSFAEAVQQSAHESKANQAKIEQLRGKLADVGSALGKPDE